MRIGGDARRAFLALATAGLCALAAPSALATQARVGAGNGDSAELAIEPASADIRQVALWIVEAGDNAGRPFAIVDKRAAQLVVFGPDGRIAGAASALLGQASGDDAVPGLGALDPADIPPAERTTPAGRFASEPGRNLDGEDVVWFDYEAGLAIHRLRPGRSHGLREQRLASVSPDDNRVSLGCVVVAPAFYETVVQPMLGRRHGVVYVLPESRPVAEVFSGFRVVMGKPQP